MAKSKKLAFEMNEQVSIKGAMFQIVSMRSGNILVRPLGGYDMEGEVMTLRNPVLESTSSRSSKKDDDAEE